VIRPLSLPEWPTEFICSATVPTDSSRAAHTAAGERAALDALARAGCTVAALPPRSGQRPAWPAGFTGSIAHDDTLAIAVVARAAAVTAIGVDVERFDALDPRDATLVLREDELELVGDDPIMATRVWSAKESAFKAWCTGLDVDLDHVDPLDIHIELVGVGARALSACATGALGKRVASIGALRGCYARVDDVVITLVWSAARSPAC